MATSQYISYVIVRTVNKPVQNGMAWRIVFNVAPCADTYGVAPKEKIHSTCEKKSIRTNHVQMYVYAYVYVFSISDRKVLGAIHLL